MSRSEDKSKRRKASARQESTKSKGDTRQLWLGSKRREAELKQGQRQRLSTFLICLGDFAVLLENAQGGGKKEKEKSYFDLQKRGKVIRKT